jgi:hypothetical protein
LPFQVIDPMSESLGLSLQLVALTSQGVTLAFGLFGTLAPVGVIRSAIRFIALRRFRHVPVMPEFPVRYKTR